MFKTVLRFYRGLAPCALKTLGRTLVRVDSWAGILTKVYFVAVGVLSRPLAAKVNSLWDGLPWWVVAGLLAAWVVGLFVWGIAKANFEVFAEEKRRADDAETEKQMLAARLEGVDKRRSIKNLLGEATAKGTDLRTFGYIDAATGEERINTKEIRKEWVGLTTAFLGDAFDKSVAAQFMSAGDYKVEGLDSEENFVMVHDPYFMPVRVWRLGQIVDRADTLEVNPDFDPEEWKGRFKAQ